MVLFQIVILHILTSEYDLNDYVAWQYCISFTSPLFGPDWSPEFQHYVDQLNLHLKHDLFTLVILNLNIKCVYVIILMTLLRHNMRVLGSNPPAGPLVWSFHVLSRYSSFLPHANNIQVKLIGDSQLPVDVNVSVNACLSLYYVSQVTNWQPVQGVPRLAPAPQQPSRG